MSFLTQRFAFKSSPTRLELRARSECDLRIVDAGAAIVLNSIPHQAELLSQVR